MPNPITALNMTVVLSIAGNSFVQLNPLIEKSQQLQNMKNYAIPNQEL